MLSVEDWAEIRRLHLAERPIKQVGSWGSRRNIISDQVFYNTSSMTLEQIRDFITTHGEGCTVPAESADQYCQAIPGAATVIAAVSAACGINPQVMLITLQKESQLLDRTDPTDTTIGIPRRGGGEQCPRGGELPAVEGQDGRAEATVVRMGWICCPDALQISTPRSTTPTTSTSATLPIGRRTRPGDPQRLKGAGWSG
ncbi:MAG TPA: hypothetical protein VFC16_14160 [Nakamurella sp.]|nr:hypothetical protein [Nakamurella sp.]